MRKRLSWLLSVLLVVVGTRGVFAANSNVTIVVNAQANRRAIDPRIYGTAFADTAALQDLNFPVNRHGGNTTTRYNWQQNAANRGNDWYFQSIADSSATPGDSADSFISDSKVGGAEPLLTIPMIGWVARLGAGRSKLWSYSIIKYGAQTGNDWEWCPDAGNGVQAGTGKDITTNDPNDASVLSDSTFQQDWVRHLTNRWGAATNGGLRYYILDNEHSIWQGTHRDVHPVGATMEEIRNKMIDYAGKIKAAEPDAIVIGPEEWGWSGYVMSGYDQQYCGSRSDWSVQPDRNAHGGMDYLPWLLNQMRLTNSASGQRLLDVFSVHIYPQGGEFGNDTSTDIQLRRNRSTRCLWDTNYVDETWIATQVKLIPRLRGWVDSYYPGTSIAITEYNWGAEGHINGATAQADILGIFGREGLDIGTRWTTPASDSPTYKAMKIYRNYDGSKSTFGETSVLASVSMSVDGVSSFAAQRRADGAVTVMVINKMLSDSATVTLSLTNFNPDVSAQVWQLTAANAITSLPDVPVNGHSLVTNVPAQSVTLFVVPARDADGDGMDDRWELHYFGGTSAANGGPADDWDGDACRNGAEFVAGTDPTNRNSRFRVNIGLSNDEVRVSFPAVQAATNYHSGYSRFYGVERSSNLLSGPAWAGIPSYTNIPGVDGTVVYTNAAPTGFFYRGKVWLK